MSSARVMTTKTPPVPPIRFAVRAKPSPPWPFSPLLELPGGTLHNYGGGKILSGQKFVYAVGLSPQHFIVVERAPGVGPVQPVLEQAVGFLWGLGARVQRVKLRCPISWFSDSSGDFQWKRCVVFFARVCQGTDPTDPPWIPANVMPVVPVGVVASAGMDHWLRMEQILDGIEAADADLLSELGSTLAGMARRWEFYLARTILLSQKVGEYDASDQDLVAQCDRVFYRILTKFEPGYELLPATIARLL